eukprot:gnl/Chilomastix_cuspidata/3435.p1 GENE.gnl/Chilomastix_cuspidata/3435~~gnl/Chilomastix_cuspidata/3435.p1  ORF type:complete len:1027 (-),score=101.72 gnl/Chilomastix_cuspidata/3435:10-3090(-)
MSVSLLFDRKARPLVGTSIALTVVVKDFPEIPFHSMVFEFSVSLSRCEESFKVIRRFSYEPSCTWCPLQEGEWFIKCVPKLRKNSLMQSPSVSCTLHIPPVIEALVVQPRVIGNAPVVFTTYNPLTALYCIPPLPKDSSIRAVRIALQRRDPGTARVRSGKAAPPRRRKESTDDHEEPHLEAVSLEPDEYMRAQHSRQVSPSRSSSEFHAEGAPDLPTAPPELDLFRKPVVDELMQEHNQNVRWFYTPFKELHPGRGFYIEIAHLEPRVVYQLKHQFLSVRSSNAAPKPVSVPIETPAEESAERPASDVAELSVSLASAANSSAPDVESSSTYVAPRRPPVPGFQILEISKPLEYMTDRPSAPLPKFFVTVAPHSAARSITENIILVSSLSTTSSTRTPSHFAFDAMKGNHVWCLRGNTKRGVQNIRILTVLRGGSMLATLPGKGVHGPRGVVTHAAELMELSISGNVKNSLSITALNEELDATGHAPVVAFGNDAAVLPNGQYAILCQQERHASDELCAALESITDPRTNNSESVQLLFAQLKGVQAEIKKHMAPSDTTLDERAQFSTTSDMIVVLDKNLHLVWAWAALDHLDPNRFRGPVGAFSFIDAPNCSIPTALSLGFLSLSHTCAESIVYTDDGNLLLSLRNQDWVIKVAYENGHGDGRILWRLGPEGDFNVLLPEDEPLDAPLSSDTSSFSGMWWSHPQQVTVSRRTCVDGEMEIVMFDTAARLHELDPQRRPAHARNGNSRGIVIRVNERTRRARITSMFDLGFYSEIGGGARRLENGNFFFTGGSVFPASQAAAGRFTTAGKSKVGSHPMLRGASAFVELTPEGEVVYAGRFENSSTRVFRLPSLYVGASAVEPQDIRRTSNKFFGALKRPPLVVPSTPVPSTCGSVGSVPEPPVAPLARRATTTVRLYVDNPTAASCELVDKLRLHLVQGRPNPLFSLSDGTALILLERTSGARRDFSDADLSFLISLPSKEAVDERYEHVARAFETLPPPAHAPDGAYEFHAEALGLIWTFSAHE